MICCGIDPSLAAWLAEGDDHVPADDPPVAALVILVLASLALALAAVFDHA